MCSPGNQGFAIGTPSGQPLGVLEWIDGAVGGRFAPGCVPGALRGPLGLKMFSITWCR